MNLTYLQTYLKRLDVVLRAAVKSARAAGFDPDNEFQGLFVGEDEIERHLNLPPGTGLWGVPLVIDDDSQQQVEAFSAELHALEQEAQKKGELLRLVHLANTFRLTLDDLNILVICLAPALDRRYERIYGFLQDDVTKRRPTVNLVLNLLGQDWEQRVCILDRLREDAPLIRYNILIPVPEAADPHSPFMNHLLKADPRVVQYVQGIDSIPKQWQNVARFIDMATTPIEHVILGSQAEAMVQREYATPLPIFHFYGNYGSGKRELALLLAKQHGYSLIEINLQTLQKEGGGDIQLLEMAFREAMLRSAALLIAQWESVLDGQKDPPIWLWERLLTYPHLVVLNSKDAWEPRGATRQRPFLRLELSVPDFESRLTYWQQYLGDARVDPSELAYKFKLTGGQIRDAVYTSYDLAIGNGRPQPILNDLYAASRAQSSRTLSSLAIKIPPNNTWDHIILPPDRIQQLREICEQVKQAVQVYGRWGFKGRGALAQGVTALFAGQSGTGKTMAAEIIAYELGLELFKIDLSSVVSKYIGETEKNLAAIFDEAAQSNAILFFDEADALFGKRSEVKDSHDRYANIEIAYLLQRMETYDGVAILATNLRQNLDEAFTRRLDFLIDFPFPEEEDRQKIWEISFPSNAPLAKDVDLTAIARRYRLAGGNIRNAALASAFLAAGDGSREIHIIHIIHAIRREHQKMGKLMDD